MNMNPPATLRTCFAAVAALIATAMAIAMAASPAHGRPLPNLDDRFYNVPQGIGGLANGTVIDSRKLTARAFLTSRLPATAWEVKFKTVDNHGDPSAYTTIILEPTKPWGGSGSRPVLSYQIAEDGVGPKCTASLALQGHGGIPATNALIETGHIAKALERGWTVAVPNYQGPNSEFLGAAGTAHGVLDGIRAAQQFGPGGVTSSSPVGLWGYSGGALATATALQLQPTYAPEMSIAGAALGGTVGDLEATIAAFSHQLGVPGAILVGLDRSYPDINVQKYLSSFGRHIVARSQTDCAADSVLKFPFATVNQLEAWPGALTDSPLSRFLRGISPLGLPGAPATPTLLYHAKGDQFAPWHEARLLEQKYCDAGTIVTTRYNPAGEHATEWFTGIPIATSYLADRFAERPPDNSCRRQ